MKQKIILALVLLLTTSLAYGQVTIGSNKKPVAGTLLMLDDGTTGSDNENAKKGLVLPRVELTNLTPVNPNELSTSVGESSSWDLDKHIGLVVYNAKESTDIYNPTPPIGLYVWDGTRWESLGIEGDDIIGDPSAVEIYTDTRPDLRSDMQNQTYTYRKFGNVAGTWMTQNLNYLPDDNSITLSTRSDDYATRAYFHPNGTGSARPSTWTKEQGLLYSYAAATMGTRNAVTSNQGNDPNENKAQGICPPNWHVPTDYEWSVLEEELALHPDKYSNIVEPISTWRPRLPSGNTPLRDEDDYSQRGSRPTTGLNGHASAMKQACNPVANQNNDTKAAGFTAENGGFSALLVGNAYTSNASSYGSYASLWSSSSYNTNSAWSRFMGSNAPTVNRGDTIRNSLFSVRCKKDN